MLVSATRNSSQSAPYNQYRIRVNGDSGANYSVVRMLGDSSGIGSSSESGSVEFTVYFSEPSSASSYAVTVSQFMDYAQTDKHKTILTRNDAPSQGITGAYAARWANTAAITSISIFPPPGFGAWAIGSTFSLYGVK
jgi:Tfp pilus assembly protein PilW